MSVNQKYWAGISPHVHKSLVRGAAGLLAFGLFLPTGVAAAAPLDPLSTDEIVVEATLKYETIGHDSCYTDDRHSGFIERGRVRCR